MKIAAIACIALICISSAAAACPPIAYLGLYADPCHSVCRVNAAPFVQFEVWVWYLPSVDGVKCVEFDVAYPSSVVASTITFNSAYATMGCGSSQQGYSCCSCECHTQWNWIFHRTCYLTSATVDYIRIVPHPLYGGPRVATCEAGYPAAPAKILNHLAINQSCIVGVAESSWGAIKALYR